MPAINDSWACSDEFTTKWGYRLLMAILDPHKITTKMPHTGIDVTLTSWFTGPAFSSATFSSGATTVCATGSRV
jgi:hypothetical protein